MRRLIIAAALAVFSLPVASADLYSPDKPLKVIETEHFSFIFPEESTPAIEYLESFAEDAYGEIASLLGATMKLHIPVIMTPDSEELNGYFTAYPYIKIVLYQAPIDPNSSLGSFKDDLRKLFYHELTHAVSLSIRTPIEDAIVAVFGSPLGLSTYATPMSFVEGVTVSLESRDGFGRATDPLAAAIIRQDIIENRWKSFSQASGAFDRYPNGNLYYIYGGFFSKYLEDSYGMEKYAELWKGFGVRSLWSSLNDSIFGKGRFSKIYGQSLDEAWDDFKATMTPRTPVYMATEPIRSLSSVGSLSASDSSLFYADASNQAVYAYDTASGKERALFRAGSYVSRLDARADGSRILVSTAVTVAGFPRLALKEWDEATGSLRDLPATRVRDAAYLDGGAGDGEAADAIPAILGIAIDGYQTDVVVVRGSHKTALLSGSERVSYASPVSDGHGTLYALARVDGVVSVIRISLSAGDSVSSIERLALPKALSWVRYLSLDDGTLRFSWDDASFYRLAELTGDTLRYEAVPISGGVHKPVGSAGRVYYLGRFSEGVAPCAFPGYRDALGFVEATVAWIPAGELLSTVSVYDAPPELPANGYNAATYLLPRFWLPTASVDLNGIAAIGAMAVIADPAERVTATIAAGWNLRAEAVDLSVSAAWTRFDAPVTVGVRDAFNAPIGGSVTRVSSASLGVGDAYSSFGGASLSWNVQTAAEGYALVPAGLSPYALWSNASGAAESSLAIELQRAPLSDPEAATGIGAALFSRLDLPLLPTLSAPQSGFEARITGRLGPGAMAFTAYGAVAATGGISYGPDGRRYASGITLSGLYPAWAEFSGTPSGPWFAQGEASLRLLGAELQNGFGLLYANRLSVRAGARLYAVSGPAWADGLAGTGASLFARATLTWTPVLGRGAAIHPTSYLEAWCRPDVATDSGMPYGITYRIAASL